MFDLFCVCVRVFFVGGGGRFGRFGDIKGWICVLRYVKIGNF